MVISKNCHFTTEFTTNMVLSYGSQRNCTIFGFPRKVSFSRTSQERFHFQGLFKEMFHFQGLLKKGFISKDFSEMFHFQGLFKKGFIFKDFSRKSFVFKYLSNQ